MSAIANEIPMEPSIDALDVAPAVAPVDAPMDASINVEAESNAAAGDGPATPRRDRSSLLESLEDSKRSSQLPIRSKTFNMSYT